MNVECRKRDLVIRITNWFDDKDEPGIDVEVYVGGKYDRGQSQCFTIHGLVEPGLIRREALNHLERVVKANLEVMTNGCD